MQRPFPALVSGLLVLSVVATATAADVYQWKDAHGVTQYSSTKPAKGAYKTRSIHENDAQAATPTKPAENPACAIARKNVEMLQGKAPVRIDSKGDGKPDKTLSDAERAAQLQFAQATIKVSCTSAPVANKPSTQGN